MPDILSSWKEIAAYLGKGVRTVQRWERELGLPVHRPDARRERIVMAFEEELARWVQGQKQMVQPPMANVLRPSDHRALKNTAVLVERMKNLTSVAAELHDEVVKSLERMERIRGLSFAAAVKTQKKLGRIRVSSQDRSITTLDRMRSQGGSKQSA